MSDENATQPAAEPAAPSTEDRLASALDRLGERLEKLEARPARSAAEPPRDEARAGARFSSQPHVRTQRELGELAVSNPRAFAALMDDEGFDPSRLPVK